jgi:hypothetical protein
MPPRERNTYMTYLQRITSIARELKDVYEPRIRMLLQCNNDTDHRPELSAQVLPAA